MATIDDIITLAKAGFSSDQITKLLSAQNPAKPAAPAPAPAPNPTPVTNPTPAPATNPPPSSQDAVTAKLDSILNLMQSSNILNSQQPKAETMDDIIASIINPKDEGGKE